MSKHSDLTKKDILHVAELAKLNLTDKELEKYHGQISETIDAIENLDELDTSNVEPTSHSTKAENVYFKDGERNERQFSQEEALQNAKKTKEGEFVVKRIM